MSSFGLALETQQEQNMQLAFFRAAVFGGG